MKIYDLIPKESNFEKFLLKLCKSYLKNYNQFSYNPYKNGEFELLNKLSKLNFETIFDVGSNIGDWSLYARKIFLHSFIHCFEISKSTFSALKRIEDKKIQLNNFGLSDKELEILYKDYGQNSAVNTTVLEGTIHDNYLKPELIKCKVTTGDLYCSRKNINHIDLLKIDVEGAESSVLYGFSNFLSEKKIRIIQFEYGYHNGDAKFLMKDFFYFFKKFSYIIGRLNHGPISFLGDSWDYKYNDFNSGPNYIAINKYDLELIKLLGK
jgi:FkbM family methyltransferase